jgi:hypothetical protein
MWFVFCPSTGSTMEFIHLDADTGESKSNLFEFETAVEAAMWVARFMTEAGPDIHELVEELQIVNLEKGVTITVTRKKNDGVSA